MNFGVLLNKTVFELDGAIFHCINQVNSDRAVAVGQNTCAKSEVNFI